MVFDPDSCLAEISQLQDSEIDLARTALALAAQDHLGLSLDKYNHHLNKIADETGRRFSQLAEAGAEDSAETKLAALKHILADKYNYRSTNAEDRNLDHNDLIRVIDGGKGSSIAICILYIHAARMHEWDIAGLFFPGYFLCRLQERGARLIFDAGRQCKIMQAPDLRALVKKTVGEKAELHAHYYEPLSNREILIRLQNARKSKQIEMEDYEGALRTVELMRRMDPAEYRLLLDAGVLYARTRRTEAAIGALEEYLKKAPNDRDRHDAALFLQQIRKGLF